MKVLPDEVSQKEEVCGRIITRETFLETGKQIRPGLGSFLCLPGELGAILDLMHSRSGLSKEPVVPRSRSHRVLHKVDFHVPTVHFTGSV